ncbi:hypothetical protein D3C78_1001690 [compost metagenome]
MNELRCWHVRLVHFHEVDVDEKRLVRFGRRVEELQRGFLDITVKEGNPDHPWLAIDHRRVHVLAIDLELFDGLFPGFARERPLGHFGEHRPGVRVHVGEPLRVGIGVGIEVIEADVFHHVIPLGVGQRIVVFAQVPFAGEVGVIATGLEHRGQRPLSRGQTATLALEGHGGHAAAVRNASGLHRRPAGGATGLGVERVKGCAFCGQLVDAGGRHASADTPAIGAQVTVAGVVGDDKQDVGFFGLRGLGKTVKRDQQ